MKRKKRQNRRKAKAGIDPAELSTLLSTEKKQQVARRIRRGFWTGLAISLALASCNWLLEEIQPVRLFKQWFYDVLQLRLASTLDSSNLPVVVLDISNLPNIFKKGSSSETITQRRLLREVVDAILEKRPAAVGIDIDFSPDAKGYVTPDDDEFLNHILQIRKDSGVPIYVGVHESISLGPEEWLLKPEYMRLASCIVIPTSEKGESTRRLPEWLELHYKTQAGGDYVQKCYSISAATARRHIQAVPIWLAPFVRTIRGATETEDDPLFSPREFLVDYSPLDILSDNTTNVLDASSVKHLDLADKIILLGRSQKATDMFIVPGRPERPFAGVFLHACAAYTLLQERPLYFLTALGRVTLDLLFATLISGSVLLVWSHRNRRTLAESAPHHLHTALTGLVLSVLFVAAIVFVHYSRLMWDDFLLMSAALLMHDRLARRIDALAASMRNWFGSHRGKPLPN